MDKDRRTIEQYLNDNTFYCERYRARISDKQCVINCARTVYNKDMHDKRMIAHKKFIRFGNDEYLLYTKLFLGKMTCAGCDKFKNPSLKIQKKVSMLQKKYSFNLLCDDRSFTPDDISACSSL